MHRRIITFAALTAVGLAACAADPAAPAPTRSDAPSASSAGATLPPAPTAPAGPSAGLQSALEDVGRLAPALESHYRGGAYPRVLDDVIASLDDAGLTLAPGNALGAYAYDEEAVEFELCVENESGAFATYDTAPMSLRQQGESGGCPAL